MEPVAQSAKRDRDRLEEIVSAWDTLERNLGRPAVVDFDLGMCHSTLIYERLDEVRSALEDLLTTRNRHVRTRVVAHLAYLRELTSPRESPLGPYLIATQGVTASTWPPSYVEAIRCSLVKALADIDVPWGAETLDALAASEGPEVAIEEAPDRIAALSQQLRDPLEDIVGDLPIPRLSIQIVDEDAYWAYWIDGDGNRMRLRINRQQARFTSVLLRQFTLHEVIGHAIQLACWSRTLSSPDSAHPRYTSVHGPEQIMLEGVAQALPRLLTPDDDALTLRVQMDHYRQLVLGDLHVLANRSDAPGRNLVDRLRSALPWTTEDVARKAIRDRQSDPLLRSYLWSYPVGIDYFLRLARDMSQSQRHDMLRIAYMGPLSGGELTAVLGVPNVPVDPHLVSESTTGE